MRAGAGTTIEERQQPVVDHFAAEMDHFSDCVMKGTTPRTPGEEGLADLRIMMAIYRSARERQLIKL
jgi:predicted dehydrogenase